KWVCYIYPKKTLFNTRKGFFLNLFYCATLPMLLHLMPNDIQNSFRSSNSSRHPTHVIAPNA
ncbi:MAG TPA: hypothetical protein PK715_10720, partial [Chitinophagales bacterium]|nr:hypothetical protein [Chitinophagales bacterium]